MEPESPYSPPTEIEGPSPAELERKKRFWLRTVMGSIALIVIPPMFGLIMTISNMTKALADAEEGGNLRTISNDTSNALLATAYGLVFSTIGILLLIISLIRFFSYRSRFGKPTG